MKLVVATGDYAHTRPLGDPGDGDIQLDWRPGRPETIFNRALSKETPYDVAEMSLATTWALAARDDARFVAIPVFPSRMFRLSAFYVREGIDRPEQLAGGRMGVVRYGQTAVVWGRALLRETYGLDCSQMRWWVAERQTFEPEGVSLNEAGSAEALQTMLVAGRLDCLFATTVPEAFSQGKVKRLFPDWADKERELFEQIRALPIMHTVLVRRRLVEEHPGLPGALVGRFEAAKRDALRWLRNTDASVLPVPLHHGWIEMQTRRGRLDAFPSGIEPNRAVLEAFARHMYGQRLTSRRVAPDEVFHSVS